MIGSDSRFTGYGFDILVHAGSPVRRRQDGEGDVPDLADDGTEGRFEDYSTEVSEGMVVLDAVHRIQAEQAPDLACRWNCKAGKCGSCSAEINGKPRLMCMTRLNELPMDEPVTVEPMRAFPLIRDLVTDVSWNFRVKPRIAKFAPRPPDAPDGTWRMAQRDIDRVQEFRKCIECFLCQDVCHVLRDHHLHEEFIGPRFLVYAAALEMHPLDTADREVGAQERLRHRLLQHHQVLHEGVPRAHPHHRQRDHPAEGARGGSLLRSGEPAAADVQVVMRAMHVSAGLTALPPRTARQEVVMFELRPLSAAAIPAALAKAERYRLLNESGQAESICQDVLAIDPDNQDALAMMILAITDQFRDEGTAAHVGPRRAPGAGPARRLHPGLLRRDHQRAPRARGARRRPRDDGLRVAARRAARLRSRHRPAARPATTTRCCAGTPACARCSACPRPRQADRAESAIMSE